jgi:hypothetical protein
VEGLGIPHGYSKLWTWWRRSHSASEWQREGGLESEMEGRFRRSLALRQHWFVYMPAMCGYCVHVDNVFPINAAQPLPTVITHVWTNKGFRNCCSLSGPAQPFTLRQCCSWLLRVYG